MNALSLYRVLKRVSFSLYYGVCNTIRFQDFRFLTACSISFHPPSKTRFPHPVGIVIGKPPGTLLGKNCTVMQNVTIGVRRIGDTQGPKIGDNVFIGPGAVILGNIIIEDNVVIGPNVVVLQDISRDTKLFNDLVK